MLRISKTSQRDGFLVFLLGVLWGEGGLFGGGFGGAAYHVGVLDGGVGFFHLGFE